jgi:hypothetical protein
MDGSAFEAGVAYEPPTIVDFGDLVELTTQHTNGNFTDQAFPAGTPKGSLTFS